MKRRRGILDTVTTRIKKTYQDVTSTVRQFHLGADQENKHFLVYSFLQITLAHAFRYSLCCPASTTYLSVHLQYDPDQN